MVIRILFVSKDPTTADLLIPSLERKGYEVFLARTRHQAVSRGPSVRPDILVVDVASFRTSGYRVLDAVRSRLAGVPTILLLQKGHAIAGSQADAYMTPPFTTRRLLYRVRKVAASLPARELRAGDLRFDPVTRTLRKGEITSRLRPKEAALLALFMRNPGRVLNRREIMKEVWETDFVGDTGTLNVHIHWLRQRIEDNPGKPRVLRTARGVGYRFESQEPETQAD